MKPATLIGILLIVLGIVALAYGGISYKDRDKVDLGPVEITAEEKKTVPLPPLLGGLALVSGVVLVIAGARKG